MTLLKPLKNVPERDHHGGPCVPGVQRLFVNVYGDLFPCERVSESSQVMKIGSLDEGFNIENIRRILNIGKITEEKCKNCWAFRFCQLCAASADVITGFSAKKKMSHCNNVRASVEEAFKDYCTLRKLGHDFEV